MRNFSLLFFFITVFFSLGSFASASAQPKKSDISSIAAAPGSTTAGKSIGVFNSSADVARDNEKILAIEQATANYTEQLAEYTSKLATFTKWLVVVGVLELALLIYQLILLRRNIIDTGRASKATEDSVSTMRSTAERQLRAYVSVSVSENFFFGAGQIVWAQITIKNCGQTPAHDVSIKYKIEIVDFPNPQLTPNGDMELTQSGLVIFPGNTHEVTKQMRDVLSAADRAAVEDDNTKRFYAYGAVEYTDAFGQRRVTNFRFMHGGQDARGIVLKASNLGNEAT